MIQWFWFHKPDVHVRIVLFSKNYQIDTISLLVLAQYLTTQNFHYRTRTSTSVLIAELSTTYLMKTYRTIIFHQHTDDRRNHECCMNTAGKYRNCIRMYSITHRRDGFLGANHIVAFKLLIFIGNMPSLASILSHIMVKNWQEYQYNLLIGENPLALLHVISSLSCFRHLRLDCDNVLRDF